MAAAPLQPLQQDEVVAFVQKSENKSCAVVHLQSHREARVEWDPDEGIWSVRAPLGEDPPADVVRALNDAGLDVATTKIIVHVGRDKGKMKEMHSVNVEVGDLPSAAAAALRAMRIIASVPPTERLWVTARAPRQRGDPPTKP